MSLTLFGSIKSTSFQCEFKTGAWGSLGTIYYCEVQNYVNITSLDAAQVDSFSGTHKAGYNNDNVVAFYVNGIGQIHYCPRGLNKFFKNLKGVCIYSTGLKEIHQSDLKDFPKLEDIYLHNNNLEILEENLFEFNPNLEYIYLQSNKISHIDPKVLDKLSKLKYLHLESNSCINMVATNPTDLLNVIKTAQAQCTNSSYSNLEQKIKNLEIESKNLNSENLKLKLENLENEIKNSKFSNFFQENLKNLKAILNEKEKDDKFFDKISTLINEKSSALEAKINNVEEKLVIQGIKISGIGENLTRISDAIATNNNNNKVKFLTLIKAIEKIYL